MPPEDFDLLPDALKSEGEPEVAVEPAAVEATPPVVVVPEVVEDTPPESEMDNSPLTAREIALLQRLEEMTGQSTNARSPQSEEDFVVKPEDRNFLEGITDLDEVLATPEGFNKVLQSVYNMALQDSARMFNEQLTPRIQNNLAQHIDTRLSMKEVVTNFYVENSDLEPMKQTVAAIATEIAKEHPEYAMEQLLNESAIRTRQVLKINQPKHTGAVVKEKAPAFVGQRRSPTRGPGVELTGLDAEIMDLIS